MLFKRLYGVFTAIMIIYISYGQVPKKRYKWKALGPFTISESDADSANWTSTGLGWIEDVLIDKHWYAGSITGGLYRSKNGGKKWKKIDSDDVQMGTLCIVKIGNSLFRGTGLTHYDEQFGFGILRSDNNGKTWNKTGLEFKSTDLMPIWGISGNIKDSLLIACSPNCIYTSMDFGQSWQENYSELDGDFRTSLVSRHKSSTAFVAGKHLIRSEDNGNSWFDITNRLACYDSLDIRDSMERIAICEDPLNKGRILILYSIGNKLFIDESADYGNSWKNLYFKSNIRGMSIHHTEIAVSSDNNVLIGGVRVYLSTDSCKTFNQSTFPRYKVKNFAHDDIRGLQILENNAYVIATDGGVFLSDDSGVSWKSINGKGLNTTMAYGIELLDDGRIIMGCQDLGTFLFDGKKWLSIASMYGDGGDAHQLSSEVVTMINGKLRLLNLSNLKRHDFIHPLERKIGTPYSSKLYPFPNAKDTFFYAGVNIWIRKNQDWNNLTAGLRGKDYMIGGFDINESNTNQLFFAFDEPTWNSSDLKNKLFKSEDGGSTWEDYTRNLPILAWRSVSSISTNPQNPDEVYVALAVLDESEVHKVYKSMDGGLNWVNYSEGLKPFETFKIMHLPNCTGKLLSTLDGMYYRNEGMIKWQKIDGKMPNIAVRDFEYNLEKRVLYASTYGAGLWKMKIPKKMLRY